MASQEDVKPVYAERKGYFDHAPASDDSHQVSYTPELWDPVNQAIDELIEITGDSTYARMKIVPEFTDIHKSGKMVWIASYRSKLGGVVARLHGEYFPDEAEPFSGGPDNVTIQSQIQDQKTDVSVIMVLQIQEKIDELLLDPDTTPEEKTFLEKVKPGLSTAKNAVELVQFILNMAKSTGIDLGSLAQLFS